MNLVCEKCDKQFYSAADLRNLRIQVCQKCGGQLKSRRGKERRYISHCPYLSCRYHYLENLTGRCRLQLQYKQGQEACEDYKPKERTSLIRLPKWYKEVTSRENHQ